MIRYIIEKNITNEYATGTAILMDGDEPKTFVSESEAIKWLMDNDEDFRHTPISQLTNFYNIKPYVI